MLSRFAFVLAGHWRGLFLVGGFGVVLHSVFAAADPLIMKLLVDEGLMARDMKAFALIAIGVVAFSIVIRIGLWAYELWAQTLRNRITETLSGRMLDAFHRLPYADVRARDHGYFLSRIYDEPATVAQGVVGSLIGVATQSVTFCVAAAIAFYLDWRIMLILSVIVPVLIVFGKRFAPRIQSVATEEQEEEANMRASVGRVVAAYPTTRLFQLSGTASAAVHSRLERYLGVLYRRVKVSTTYSTSNSLAMALAEVVVLLVAGYSVISGRLTLGGLFAFMKAFWKVVGAFKSLVSLVPELAQVLGYIDRLQDFDHARRADAVPASDPSASRSEPQLRLVDVGIDGTAADGNERPIVDGVSLSVEAPERLLVLGDNGTGKSTLAYLLVGLLEPSRGDIRTPSVERISAQLTPSAFLPGTLRDNLDVEQLDLEGRRRLERMAAGLGLTRHLDRDPQTFSQGERKKAQILMTLLRDADVYLFDEPLAHVDEPSKERIAELIFERTEGKILIAVLHGDSAVQGRFDRILRLERVGADRAAPDASFEDGLSEDGISGGSAASVHEICAA